MSARLLRAFPGIKIGELEIWQIESKKSVRCGSPSGVRARGTATVSMREKRRGWLDSDVHGQCRSPRRTALNG
jgi:hypothetical protein